MCYVHVLRMQLVGVCTAAHLRSRSQEVPFFSSGIAHVLGGSAKFSENLRSGLVKFRVLSVVRGRALYGRRCSVAADRAIDIGRW